MRATTLLFFIAAVADHSLAQSIGPSVTLPSVSISITMPIAPTDTPDTTRTITDPGYFGSLFPSGVPVTVLNACRNQTHFSDCFSSIYSNAPCNLSNGSGSCVCSSLSAQTNCFSSHCAGATAYLPSEFFSGLSSCSASSTTATPASPTTTVVEATGAANGLVLPVVRGGILAAVVGFLAAL